MDFVMLPIAPLLATFDTDARAKFNAAWIIATSMNRDYHDCKGHPSMTLDDHIRECNLAPAAAEFVRAQFDGRRSPYIIAIGDRRIECNVETLRFVDLDDPTRTYPG